MVENNHILMLTGPQAAVFLGITYRRFQQYLAENDPPPAVSEGRDRKWPSHTLGEWTRKRVLRDLVGEESEDGSLNPVQERARKDKELADKTALENRVRREELIEVSKIEAAWVEIVTRVKSKMLRVPWSASGLVLGIDDQVSIQIILEDQIRDALTELSIDA